jgi:hypothetical protein
MKIIFGFPFYAITNEQLQINTRNLQEIGHKHIYTLYMDIMSRLRLTNMAMTQNFVVISDKINTEKNVLKK